MVYEGGLEMDRGTGRAKSSSRVVLSSIAELDAKSIRFPLACTDRENHKPPCLPRSPLETGRAGLLEL